jgi:hypothetical protein
LKRFKGETPEKSTLENSETFAGDANASEDEWIREVERFDRIMSEWKSLIESAAEARLQEQVSSENTSSWGSVIADINTHNAHHGGQIVILRKLQGSWDASKGVS